MGRIVCIARKLLTITCIPTPCLAGSTGLLTFRWPIHERDMNGDRYAGRRTELLNANAGLASLQR